MPADASALERRLHEMAVEMGARLGDAFVEGARGRASRRTGELVDGIEHDDPVDEGSRVVLIVRSTAEHSEYQDKGTGIYGPEGQRIQGNPLLAFDWPAAGGLVIVHSVAGAPGTHFWEDTVNDWPNIVRSVA